MLFKTCFAAILLALASATIAGPTETYYTPDEMEPTEWEEPAAVGSEL